jgi:uncharacterized protein (TIGR02001 family)
MVREADFAWPELGRGPSLTSGNLGFIMKHFLIASAAALLPMAAFAEGTTYVGAAAIYVHPDVSDGYGTLEAYIEHETASGFYAGLWLGSLSPADDPDNIEADLYVGYRATFGAISFDASYTRYYYDDSGDCCGEVILSAETTIGDVFTVGLDLSSDLEDVEYATLNTAYTITDMFEVSAAYTAYNDDGGTEYDFGVTASLSDTTSVDLRYYDNDFGDEPTIELTLAWDTDLGTLMAK